MKIYHLDRNDVEVSPEDFSKPFVARKFGGAKAVRTYTALRVCGVDRTSAFLTAWAGHWYGHPDHIEVAAKAFESSTSYQSAVENVREALGERFIKAALLRRCELVPSFAKDTALTINTYRSDKLFTGLDTKPLQRDEDQFDEFMRQRAHESKGFSDFYGSTAAWVGRTGA